MSVELTKVNMINSMRVDPDTFRPKIVLQIEIDRDEFADRSIYHGYSIPYTDIWESIAKVLKNELPI